MAFFDKLGEMAKNIGDKTGDAIETGKLNSKIKAEQAAAAEDFKKIGAYYYNLFLEQGEAVPEILEFCQSAKAHFDAANEAQTEIDRIKTENEEAQPASAAPVASANLACPSCGTQNSAGMKFCQNCGGKLEQPTFTGITCPSCGASNSSGVKFCCECGTKLELEQPKERICPSCGAVINPDIKFCSQCGQKLEE